MATKKFNKRARNLGTGFVSLSLSSAVVAGSGKAGGSAKVTNAAQAGLTTAARFGGLFVTVSLGGAVLKKRRRNGLRSFVY